MEARPGHLNDTVAQTQRHHNKPGMHLIAKMALGQGVAYASLMPPERRSKACAQRSFMKHGHNVRAQ